MAVLVEFIRYQPAGASPTLASDHRPQGVSGEAYGCRPFLEASFRGYLLYPPFNACVNWEGGAFHVRTDDNLAEQVWSRVASELTGAPTRWWCSKIPGVFQVDVGFVILTPRKSSSLVLPPLNRMNDRWWTHSGIVATDIFHAPFTINLQLNPGVCSFRLSRTEPIAQVMPLKRSTEDQYALKLADITEKPAISDAWVRYRDFAFDTSGGVHGDLPRKRRGAYGAWLRRVRKI